MKVQLLVDNPLITMTLVIAVGFVIGHIKIGGFSLGVAAVLFAGMGLSAMDSRIALPEIVYLLGLALFVYTIGLAAGPEFFTSLRRIGLHHNALAAVILVAGAAGALLLARLLDVTGVVAGGMYAGAFTNTPALAAVLDAVHRTSSGPGAVAATAGPVVGYALTYPIGVLGVIITVSVLQRLWKVDHAGEARAAGLVAESIDAWTVRVGRGDLPRVEHLPTETDADVLVSRLSRDEKLRVARMDDTLRQGDLITLVGTSSELDAASRSLGERVTTELGADQMESRRILISNRSVAGHSLRELAVRRRHGFCVTRIIRNDINLLADRDAVLQLGDQVVVVARKETMSDAVEYFGDSYRSLSEMDVLTFAVGLCLGLLVGIIPVRLPGGGVFSLGSAGGPLVVALVLGALGRTGKVLWQLPYQANLTLRQVGVVLFLAGVGTRAGGAFATSLSDPASLAVVGAGAVLTIGVSVAVLIIGHKVMKVPFSQVAGMLAGIQTQPAVLAYVNEQAQNDLPNLGYMTVYPVAMVAKIVLAQVVLTTLTH